MIVNRVRPTRPPTRTRPPSAGTLDASGSAPERAAVHGALRDVERARAQWTQLKRLESGMRAGHQLPFLDEATGRRLPPLGAAPSRVTD